MEARFDLVVLDLDGTLIDSRPDIADAVNEALAEFGLPPQPEEAVEAMIGDGARRLVERAVAGRLPPERIDEVLGRYVAHYAAHPAARTRVYKGVREGLRALSTMERASASEARAGSPPAGAAQRLGLAIASNKPAELTRAVTAILGLAPLVDMVLGDGDVPRPKPDPAMLDAAIARTGARRSATLYVGDGAVDVLTARAAGVPLCLVSWGYGAGASPDDADYRADRFENIVTLVGGARP